MISKCQNCPQTVTTIIIVTEINALLTIRYISVTFHTDIDTWHALCALTKSVLLKQKERGKTHTIITLIFAESMEDVKHLLSEKNAHDKTNY